MIRRLFWLTLGAVLGVTGYRRVTALLRSLPGVPRARELAAFTADVREGMAVYMERHSRPQGSTLEGHRPAEVPRALGGHRDREEAAAPPRREVRYHTDDMKDGR